MEGSPFDLARLIYPIAPDTFKREYWEKQPLIITRQAPHYYRDLLCVADIDRMLSVSSIRSPDVRVLRHGSEIPLSSLGGQGHAQMIEALYEKYRDGCTIAIQFLQERSRPLMRLCQSLAAEFSAAFQANVYLTPPHEQGLHTHYDTHDVFVLQTEGVKHWRVFQETLRLPLAGQPYQDRTMGPGNLLSEVDLHPGDALYVPRGYCHDAAAVDSTSLHVTVGVHPVTWARVLLGALEAIIERDWRFREALPVGFAGDKRQAERAESRLLELLEIVREQIDPKLVINEAIDTAFSSRQPFLDDHLLDLEEAPRLTVETRVRRRPGLLCRLRVENDRASLCFHSKRVCTPAFVEPDLQFMTTADQFTGLDLPGRLDHEGRLVLIRRLLREGFLTICR
jgi:ribosomal protein L16 Arg81 hydroxylase